MKLKLSKGRPALQSDLIVLETTIGMPLAADFREFVAHHDGAEPENNIFPVGTSNDCGVNGFIPVRDIPREMQRIENLPKKSFPIAWAECGNYVFINQADAGSVFFWDHEVEVPVKLADTFRSFLELLEPFDVSTVKLKPGQVIKAWVDPDFLKSLKKDNS